MNHSFKFVSDVSISLFEGDETEFKLIVAYDYTPEQAATLEEPGYGANVEITDISLISSTLQPLITPGWFDAMVRADESFASSLIADAEDRIEQAKDDAAERRAEDREVVF